VASIPGCKGMFTTTDPNFTTNHKTTCDCLVSNYYNQFQDRALCVSLHTRLAGTV
jgi:hypothetical protein